MRSLRAWNIRFRPKRCGVHGLQRKLSAWVLPGDGGILKFYGVRSMPTRALHSDRGPGSLHRLSSWHCACERLIRLHVSDSVAISDCVGNIVGAAFRVFVCNSFCGRKPLVNVLAISVDVAVGFARHFFRCYTKYISQHISIGDAISLAESISNELAISVAHCFAKLLDDKIANGHVVSVSNGNRAALPQRFYAP